MNITKFEDVKNISSEEYFNNNDFSIDAFNKKYALTPDETYVKAIKRVCSYIASAEETDELKKYWEERWFNEIFNDWWHPAGSIMQGAANPRNISLSNCTQVSLGTGDDKNEWDSLEGIIRGAAYTAAKTAAYRQGLGIDFSRIRPKNTKVYNSSNMSQGVIHWMKFIDSLGYYVGQCLAENTPVLTKRGYIFVQDIISNDKVFSFNGWSPVIKILKNGKKNIFVIKTEYGDEVKASQDHELKIIRNKEIKNIAIKNCKIDDFIIAPLLKAKKNINYVTIPDFTYKLNDYNNSNRLAIPPKVPKVINEELAYLAGEIYGDGYMEKTIELALSDIWPETKYNINKILYNLFGTHIGDYGLSIRPGDGACTRLSFGRYYTEFFKLAGFIKNKAGNLIFPKVIKKSPLSVLKAFFDGLMDADGYNSLTKQNYVLGMIDYSFLKDLKNEFFKFGIIFKLKKKNRPGYRPFYHLSPVGIQSDYELRKNSLSTKLAIKQKDKKHDRLKTPYTAKQAGIIISKTAKHDINYSSYLSDTKYKKYKNIRSNYYIQKIKTIEQTNKKETYDLTILDKSHFFAIPGMYVSNSGRIPALLFSLKGDHPDVLDFIEVKKNHTKIQNANISVQLSDLFYKAAKNNENWKLRFEIPEIHIGDKIYVDAHVKTEEALQDENGKYYTLAKHYRPAENISEKINSKEMLRKIAENMYKNAEPGIQNIDIARKYSNSDAVYNTNDSYDSRIISTNACSEQYLSRDSLCVLSSINAGKFSIDNGIWIKELKSIAKSINRFLDNVNTMELRDHRYATPLQALSIRKLRRTGAGITNIAERLFKLKLDYDSSAANLVMHDFTQKFNYYLYESTIALGKEKGNFELFDAEKIKKSAFIQRMIGQGLFFDYMRNVTVSSIAPTSTISLMFKDMTMSSGVEPAFGLYYWKRTRMSGEYEYYFCVPHVIREYFINANKPLKMNSDTIKDTWNGEKGKDIAKFIDDNLNIFGENFKFKSANNIDVMDKLELVAGMAKNIDSSISVTFMLRESSTIEDVENFILKAYNKELKSIAAFPDKKMYGIISLIPFKDLAFKLKNEKIITHPQNFSEEELKELHLTKDNIVFSFAPKRPKELEADIHTVNIKNEKFVITVGLLNGAPYELFGGKMDSIHFNFTKKSGKLIKIARNKYKLKIEGGFEIEDFSKAFTPIEQVLFRMVSANLRHGTPVKFITEQLHKATDDMTSLTKAAARVLKKYIIDGEPAFGVKCPICKSANLLYIDGCISCACGFSKCE